MVDNGMGMRILKVIVVMTVGPVLGLLSGFIIGGLLVPPDLSGRGTPGDGILIMACMGYGVALSILLSALFARWIWRRSVREKTQVVR